MKHKKQAQKTKKGIKQKNSNIYFEAVLMIMIIPIFAFLSISIFNGNDSKFVSKILTIKSDVKITTDKNLYVSGENMQVSIKNESKNPIYFEPCKYLNKFEKKIDGKWRESFGDEGRKVYDEFGFNREKNMTNCEIKLPKEGAGMYRTVIQIYYECEKPGENMCRNSKAFYSNKFVVK